MLSRFFSRSSCFDVLCCEQASLGRRAALITACEECCALVMGCEKAGGGNQVRLVVGNGLMKEGMTGECKEVDCEWMPEDGEMERRDRLLEEKVGASKERVRVRERYRDRETRNSTAVQRQSASPRRVVVVDTCPDPHHSQITHSPPVSETFFSLFFSLLEFLVSGLWSHSGAGLCDV
jgi:hypothetical protein